MKNSIYFLIISILLCISLSADEPSVIGDYYVGFGYQHRSSDVSDSNTIGLVSNLAIHQNFDIPISLSYTYNTAYGIDFSSIGFDTGFRLHNKFIIGEGSSIDPYLSLSLGLRYAEQLKYIDYYYQYTGNFAYRQFFTSTSVLIPYNLSIGTEFKIAHFISFIPHIGFSGILNDSAYSTVGVFGLSTNFFIGEFASLGLDLSGDSDDGVSFFLGLRYHM